MRIVWMVLIGIGCVGCKSIVEEMGGFAEQQSRWKYDASSVESETVGPQEAYTELLEVEMVPGADLPLLEDGRPDWSKAEGVSVIRSLIVNPSAKQSTRLGIAASEGQIQREQQLITGALQGINTLSALIGQRAGSPQPVADEEAPSQLEKMMAEIIRRLPEPVEDEPEPDDPDDEGGG